MNINFRQGIITHQKSGSIQTFLQRNGDYVSLLTDNREFMYTISHGIRDYLFSQQVSVMDAWQIDTGRSCWLTIEVSPNNGAVSYITEYTQPITSTTKPDNPQEGDVWFDQIECVYKRFNSSRFVPILKLYVAVCVNGSIHSVGITQEFTGSSVGINAVNVIPGFLVFTDDGYTLKRKDGTLVTTEDYLSTSAPTKSYVKLGSVGFIGTAFAHLPAYSVVTLDSNGRIRSSIPSDSKKYLHGIIEHDAQPGDQVRVSVEGYFENPNWNWSSPNANIYMNSGGQLTEVQSLDAVPVAIAVTNKSIILRRGEIHVYQENKGDKGDTGLKGDIGSSGLKGDRGEVGATGPQGIQGVKGDPGPQGIQGVKGDRGATGLTGTTGLKGESGAKGDKGNTGNSETFISCLKQLPITPQVGVVYTVDRYFDGYDNGRVLGQFTYDPLKPENSHNGGTIISKSALLAWNGEMSTLYAMLNNAGSGNGCYIKVDRSVSPSDFGATTINNSKLPIDRAYSVARELGVEVIFYEMYLCESTVSVPVGVTSIMTNGGGVKAKTGFTVNTPVIQFGDYSQGVLGRWEGNAGTIDVDCNGTEAIGIDFNFTWKNCEVEHAKVTNHANIGIYHREGYGLKLKSYTIFAISKHMGWISNAPVSSIGLYTETSDSYYGPCQVYGSFVGVKALGGNNMFENTHCWGIYKDSVTMEDKACPMGIPIWNQGQSNTWIHPISDSPSMIDYDQPASEVNGGYGIYNSLYGFQSKFIGPTVFIPNRSNEVYPYQKIVRYRCNHVGTYIGAESFDDSVNKTTFTSELFEGSLALQSCIVGRSKFDVYTTDFPRFRRRLNCFKGVDIQTTYADVDSKINEYGIINFTQPDRKYVRINANYEGNVAQIRLARVYKGNTGDREFLATILTEDDDGYQLYLRDLKKLNIWDGTAWREANGTLV